MTANVTPSAILIDGHVHLREASDDEAALAAAARNFAAAAVPAAGVGVLMMAEARGEEGFARLRRGIAEGKRSLAGELTAEAESLWLDSVGWRLLIVAGRQLVTAEKLEVLALGTAQRIEDGAPLERVCEQIDAANGVIVLPWGCGKWLGRRRRVVAAALGARSHAQLLLGDNAGRSAFWPEPLFAQRRVLRGSDPLPLPRHWQGIGRFGSVLEVSLSADRPAADLRRALRDPALPLRPFGRFRGPLRFAFDQLQLRAARRPAALSDRALG